MIKTTIIAGLLTVTWGMLPFFKNVTDDYLSQSIRRGKTVYEQNCMHCHMEDGSGIVPMVPALTGEGKLKKVKEEAISQVLHGLKEPITIDGVTYEGAMPTHRYLSDKQIADVLNYIRNSWGNSGKAIMPEEVADIR